MKKSIFMGQKKVVRALFISAAALFLSACSDNDFILSKSDITRYLKLPQYKGVEVQVMPVTDITDEELDNNIMQYLSVNITDRAVKDGDTVNIDYEGKRDGVAFDGGTAKGQPLTIGSGSFIDGFEDGLIGVMPGETVDLNLTFPETYPNNPDLAGVDVVFTVTVNHIVVNDYKDVTEKLFLEQYPDYTSLDEYREEIRQTLKDNEQKNYESELQNAVMTNLLENAKFNRVPKILKDSYANDIKSYYEMYATIYGMTLNDFVQRNLGFTPSAFEEEVEKIAEDNAKQVMILQAIANAENLNPTQEEIDNYINENAALSSSETEQPEVTEEQLESYKEYLMMEKVFQFLAENAVVTAPSTAE